MNIFVRKLKICISCKSEYRGMYNQKWCDLCQGKELKKKEDARREKRRLKK